MFIFYKLTMLIVELLDIFQFNNNANPNQMWFAVSSVIAHIAKVVYNWAVLVSPPAWVWIPAMYVIPFANYLLSQVFFWQSQHFCFGNTLRINIFDDLHDCAKHWTPDLLAGSCCCQCSVLCCLVPWCWWLAFLESYTRGSMLLPRWLDSLIGCFIG